MEEIKNGNKKLLMTSSIHETLIIADAYCISMVGESPMDVLMDIIEDNQDMFKKYPSVKETDRLNRILWKECFDYVEYIMQNP